MYSAVNKVNFCYFSVNYINLLERYVNFVSFLSVNRVSPSQTNFLFVYRRNAKTPVRRLMLAVITRDKQLLPHYPPSFIKQCLRPKPPSVRRQTPSEINTQMNFKLHPRMIYFASFVRKRLCAKNHFMSRPIARRWFIHVVWVAYRVVRQLTRHFYRQSLTVVSNWLLSQWSRQRRNMFPQSPPAPVLTRWASWLAAALFYAEQYSEVKDIVLSFEDDGLIVSKAKSAISHADIQTELILVCEYRPLVELVLKTESQDFQISQAYSTTSRFQENLKSLDPAGILEYLTARLQNNPDLSEIIEGNGNLSPAEYSKLRKAQPLSGDV